MSQTTESKPQGGQRGKGAPTYGGGRPDAKGGDRPRRPRRQRSLPNAPILLPLGPDLTYPIVKIILKTKTAKPRTAAAMGK